VLENVAQIPDQRNIDLDVLVDLRWIDFNVNLFRLERISRRGAGHTIVESHAAGNQQVRFLNGVVDPRLAVHAHHAHVERVRGREGAQAPGA
jgi:hypothetical protein